MIYSQTYGYLGSDIATCTNEIIQKCHFPRYYSFDMKSDHQITVDPFYDALQTLHVTYPTVLQ